MKRIQLYVLMGLSAVLSCSKDGGSVEETPPENLGPIPSAAILISPADAQTCEVGESISASVTTVAFSWNPTENTEFYDLNVINLSTSSLSFKRNTTSTSETLVLEKNAPYSWQVVSKSSTTTEVGESELWRFYVPGDGIVNHAPFPAVVIKPTSGTTVIPSNNGKATLQWVGSDPDDDSLKYTVYLDTVDGQQTPATNLTDITTNSVEVDVQPDTTYYWRVKSSDGTNSSFTVVLQFRTL